MSRRTRCLGRTFWLATRPRRRTPPSSSTRASLIFNCAGFQEVYPVTPDVETLESHGVKVMQLDLADKDMADISSHFPATNAWIKEALDGGGKVLVNCFQGASRSATVVMAYLIQHQNMQADEAIVSVKQRRDIRPNNGFLNQL